MKATRKRTREVFRWHDRVFPPPRDLPVRLVLHDSLEEDFAYVEWDDDEKRAVELHVSLEHDQAVINANLNHEWAHVRDPETGDKWGRHDSDFYERLGQIERRWVEEGGSEESKWAKGVRR